MSDAGIEVSVPANTQVVTAVLPRRSVRRASAWLSPAPGNAGTSRSGWSGWPHPGPSGPRLVRRAFPVLTGSQGMRVVRTGAQGPGFIYRGLWDYQASYVVNDQANYGGAVWIALAPNTNMPCPNLPSRVERFPTVDKVGQPGPQGAQGPAGATDPQGPQGDPGDISMARSTRRSPQSGRSRHAGVEAHADRCPGHDLDQPAGDLDRRQAGVLALAQRVGRTARGRRPIPTAMRWVRAMRDSTDWHRGAGIGPGAGRSPHGGPVQHHVGASAWDGTVRVGGNRCRSGWTFGHGRLCAGQQGRCRPEPVCPTATPDQLREKLVLVDEHLPTSPTPHLRVTAAAAARPSYPAYDRAQRLLPVVHLL